MFSENDEKYLTRALNRNACILFLGAGFSSLATNRLGKTLPVGTELSADLWGFLGYQGEYDGRTSLADLFQVLIQRGIPAARIREFLEQRFLCTDVPDAYNVIVRPYWYRIYTTNIDDLLPLVFRRYSDRRLRVLAFPHDQPKERDQSLDEFQAIYLHGRLPCEPDELTFSFMQYARAVNSHLPLYDQFVADYSIHPTIFVGTQLNEPVFFQYVQERQSRDREVAERRPKSFLISPDIVGPRADALRQFNVTPVVARTEQFLDWLTGVNPSLAPRLDVLRATLPSVVSLLEKEGLSAADERDIKSFAKCFENVPVAGRSTSRSRSAYLLGSTPQWNDIANDLDAPREIGTSLAERIREALGGDGKTQVYLLTGSAGSGKSTILRRLGITLAREGNSVFLTNSEELPLVNAVANTLETIDRRTILLFDNADANVGPIVSVISGLNAISRPPIVVVGIRTNEFRRYSYRLDELEGVTEVPVPNLNRREIVSVLDVLERNNLLGRLNGMAFDARIAEFERRASRQILVAMREATSGKLFDEIIRDEYSSLATAEARILYLSVALATDAGFRLQIEDVLGCSRVPPAEALDILEKDLNNIVLKTGPDESLLVLRHQRIAQYMVDAGADRRSLSEAYVRLLSVLAGKVQGVSRLSRIFRLYRELINHYTIRNRFADDTDKAREIYDSLAPRFSAEPQFWLQYGALELQVDNLDLAENYLNQADSLDPGNSYIRNALGLLAYRRGILATNREEAGGFREIARDRLMQTMSTPEEEDLHCYHITMTQELKWILRWILDKGEQADYLGELRKIAHQARLRFGGDRKIREAAEDVDRHYYLVATD